MNEQELRDKVISIAVSFLGCNERDGSHKQIIDIYNSVTPLPLNYKMEYDVAWCATYVTAVGIEAELSDIIFRECGCQRMIELYKKAGRWVENDAYTPQKADIIFYDWDDDGKGGDNTGWSDHVGIVVSVNGTMIEVIEGNKNDAVGYRKLQLNNRYIRGYGIPDYASKATPPKSDDDDNSASASLKYNIGDVVKFIGDTHYGSANSTSPKKCKAGTAKVTSRSKGAKHPYHLVAEKGKGSTVYGWVDEKDIEGKVSNTAGNGTGTNTTVNKKAKVDSAKSFSKSIAGTYKATGNVNMRAGAGISKAVLTVVPRGKKVTCYGYYTAVNGTKWYCVVYKDAKGVLFTGFVSSKYLSK